MTVLICILVYLIPLLIGCYCVYKSMNPGETIGDYIYRKDLEDVFWIMFIPGINIISLVIWLIMFTVCRISQIRKPYDSKDTRN